MKLITAFAAAGLALGMLASTPAAAQGRHDRDWRDGRDRHDMGRHEGWRGDRGHHNGWRNNRNCRWTWRHHRRMRVCW